MKVFVSSFSPSEPLIAVLDMKFRMCIAQKLVFQVLSEKA